MQPNPNNRPPATALDALLKRYRAEEDARRNPPAPPDSQMLEREARQLLEILTQGRPMVLKLERTVQEPFIETLTRLAEPMQCAFAYQQVYAPCPPECILIEFYRT